jgi:hypothetical protein
MASDNQSLVLGVVVVLVVSAIVYLVDPTFFGLLGPKAEGFASLATASSTGQYDPGMMNNAGNQDVMNIKENPHATPTNDERKKENFANLEGYAEEDSGPAPASQPAGCYPRDQLTPSELLPQDQNSVWAQQNPLGPGSLKGKNFLSAGALLGVNTVGQSLRNANWQLRSEPPNPQQPVSIFNQSTIQPDVGRRPLEIN